MEAVLPGVGIAEAYSCARYGVYLYAYTTVTFPSTIISHLKPRYLSVLLGLHRLRPNLFRPVSRSTDSMGVLLDVLLMGKLRQHPKACRLSPHVSLSCNINTHAASLPDTCFSSLPVAACRHSVSLASDGVVANVLPTTDTMPASLLTTALYNMLQLFLVAATATVTTAARLCAAWRRAWLPFWLRVRTRAKLLAWLYLRRVALTVLELALALTLWLRAEALACLADLRAAEVVKRWRDKEVQHVEQLEPVEPVPLSPASAREE